jgi:hypothetical protein
LQHHFHVANRVSFFHFHRPLGFASQSLQHNLHFSPVFSLVRVLSGNKNFQRPHQQFEQTQGSETAKQRFFIARDEQERKKKRERKQSPKQNKSKENDIK